MRTIKIDLPSDLEMLELHTFADEHIGDAHCDMQRLRERINYVATTPNAYCVLNGDLMDNATRTSIGDIYGNACNPMQQIETAVELFRPIKDKILCVTHGNHEARTYRKEGIDLSKIAAAELGLYDRYTQTSALLFVRFGENHAEGKAHDGGTRKFCYSIYMLHGSGGGRKEGAKAIRLADMAAIVDADVFIHSHTHLPMIMRQGFYRVARSNSSVQFVEHLFVNTAANLSYGGYGEAQEFKPASMRSPIIYLNGKKWEMSARL